MCRRPRVFTLFPYTTLFRSSALQSAGETPPAVSDAPTEGSPQDMPAIPATLAILPVRGLVVFPRTRSEEHTSELQSPDHLVCRLLLEKKTRPSRAPSSAGCP